MRRPGPLTMTPATPRRWRRWSGASRRSRPRSSEREQSWPRRRAGRDAPNVSAPSRPRIRGNISAAPDASPRDTLALCVSYGHGAGAPTPWASASGCRAPREHAPVARRCALTQASSASPWSRVATHGVRLTLGDRHRGGRHERSRRDSRWRGIAQPKRRVAAIARAHAISRQRAEQILRAARHLKAAP